jgi:hypothetical protein
MDQCYQAIVKIITNLGVSWNIENFLTSRASICLSGRIWAMELITAISSKRCNRTSRHVVFSIHNAGIDSGTRAEPISVARVLVVRALCGQMAPRGLFAFSSGCVRGNSFLPIQFQYPPHPCFNAMNIFKFSSHHRSVTEASVQGGSDWRGGTGELWIFR